MSAQTRRGQPLIALALVLTSWVGFRAAVWDWPVAAQTPRFAFSPGPASSSRAVHFVEVDRDRLLSIRDRLRLALAA